MNEAELITAFIGASELAVQTMMFYLSIVTGYLIVAHFAGAKLRTRQLVVVNGIFVVFSALAMWGTVSYFMTASHFWVQSETYQSVLDEEIFGPAPLAGALEALGIVASLDYMRDIRRRAREKRNESEGETT